MSETESNFSEKLHLRATVRGRVQGVGYRQFVLSEATKSGLTGWVRNDSWNRNLVEVEAEGLQLQLEKFLAKLHEGPFGARVSEVAVQWSQTAGTFEHFEIK